MKLDNEKNRQDEKQTWETRRPGSDVEGIIKQLMNIDTLFQDFIDAETEGMILCENCYETAFDDDEEICTLEEDGVEHQFCCKECMEEWKEREKERHA